MTIPTVHANGTSKAELIAALCAASEALDAAYIAMKRCGPNGRDYYPQGPHAIGEAQREHFARLMRVVAVKEEIDRLTMAVDEQGN